ncbi:MAG: hypothetical protein CMH52_10670 [Myxococcales bacterium]|nr:hypothetical protein [Myxococcales bacterium]
MSKQIYCKHKSISARLANKWRFKKADCSATVDVLHDTTLNDLAALVLVSVAEGSMETILSLI